MWLAIREATFVVAWRSDFRIVHASVQRTHVHLVVEAEHRTALATGMKAFQISAAKHINAALRGGDGKRRKGQVFADRYHAVILRSPRQVRNTLAYVLNNWRHHGEDRQGSAQAWLVDPFSTAVQFTGWKEREREGRFRVRSTYQPLHVWEPRTWLLTTGWRRRGLVSVYEVPGGDHVE